MREIAYYDKDGRRLTIEEWAILQQDNDYIRVGLTHLAEVGVVSTIWLGLDLRYFDEGAPLIFETMVFALDGDAEYHQTTVRTSTLEDARITHESAVLLLSRKTATGLRRHPR